MNLFFSAGEASGDAYAAALLSALQELKADFEFMGIGGKRLRSAGAQIIADSSQWGVISIFETVRKLPYILGGYYRAKRALRKLKPGIFIAIDFGYANIRLCRHARNCGWKVVYWMPPGSWRRDRQGKDLAELTDLVVTPFPWSEQLLKQAGVNVRWFGHPLKEMLASSSQFSVHGSQSSDTESPSPFTLHPSPKKIAILPGSRQHEIELLLPLFAEVMRNRQEIAEFAVASSADPNQMREEWLRLAPNRTSDLFTQGETSRIFSDSQAALVCSGTATLEAALCRCPMVVTYRVGKLTELEARLIGFKVRHISLPNILLDRTVVPELVQYDATPQAVKAALDQILGEDGEKQKKAFEEIDAMLGGDHAIQDTAQEILRVK